MLVMWLRLEKASTGKITGLVTRNGAAWNLVQRQPEDFPAAWDPRAERKVILQDGEMPPDPRHLAVPCG